MATYRKNYQAIGLANSIERVEKLCVNCDEPFTVPRNRINRSIRCPKCQDAHIKRAAHERYLDIAETRGRETLRQGKYIITHDPDHTWSENSSLDYSEIRDLARKEYLTEGTRFHERAGEHEIEIVRDRGHLVLRML
jgi:predicted RNA-binding Zn-ribbon protein involved in translation (DUF1610 family)